MIVEQGLRARSSVQSVDVNTRPDSCNRAPTHASANKTPTNVHPIVSFRCRFTPTIFKVKCPRALMHQEGVGGKHAGAARQRRRRYIYFHRPSALGPGRGKTKELAGSTQATAARTSGAQSGIVDLDRGAARGKTGSGAARSGGRG